MDPRNIKLNWYGLKGFAFYLEVSLEIPQKRTETRGKVSGKTLFQVRDGPIKGQKQRMYEKTQEHYPTMK